MEIIKAIIDFILHIDDHLVAIVSEYQTWTYLILFLIIFAETGLVVAPFLPGDSLLFAAGAIIAKPESGLNVFFMFILLFIAAFLGDTVNYHIGKYFGKSVFSRDYRFLKKEHLYKTQNFYDKYGGKTIIFARFIPIIRTFAPFVAGIGSMRYSKFMSYNIFGGFAWVASFLFAGYLFGNMKQVKDNFTLVIFAIILVSILPPIFEFLRHKFQKPKEV